MTRETRRVQLEVDGNQVQAEILPGDRLLRVLRALGFSSIKYGCDTGDCGACTILVDGIPHFACLYPAVRAPGRALMTVAAMGHTDALAPLQRAFLERGAAQCGYCTPAMLLVAHALLQREHVIDEASVREALGGVLCRCTGYLKPVEAIRACSANQSAEAALPVVDSAPAIDAIPSASRTRGG
jgi:aerobic-type carbon monoxide dehydrogenase small subunit (CoxS/CutS family)